ncbi:MAG: acetate kinase [Mariprofundus sp.]|nr:acetate kinase [Mariprofundus sp.]
MSDTMILVINTGSSSIKMALIDMPSETQLAEAMAERLGDQKASLSLSLHGKTEQINIAGADHEMAMQQMLDALFARVDKNSIAAFGHRVVHGGEKFIAPTVLNAAVIAEIEALSRLAPLHNPANLLGIRAAIKQLPDIPHIAVFDTAFHHAMPEHASLYAVPYHWYTEYGVRRYGFHGTSHHYVAQQAAAMLGRKIDACNIITAHLGNGCSATAIKNGISVDTTMGMTPLEGLVMGTRSGDIDPGLHDYIARQSGNSLETITDTLNRESGLLGISGQSNDMRTLLDAAAKYDDDMHNQTYKRAALAVDMFCYRLAKSLAGLSVALGSIDAIVFTGGIGEHSSPIRAKTVAQLSLLGVSIDAEKNDEHGKHSDGFINSATDSIPVLVIATNEEKMIARYVNNVLTREEHQS